MNLQKSRRGLLALLAIVTLGVGACSTDGGDAKNDSSRSVTVETADGPVTIKGTPSRIVTLGSPWTETVISLGVQPLAGFDAVKASTKTQAPWLEGKMGDVKEVDPSSDLLTQIANLDPDVIFLDSSNPMFAPQAEKIKQSGVPVIGHLTAKQVDPWQDLLSTAGKVLDKESKATEIADSIDTKIADMQKANPALKGKTYTFSAMQGPTQITVLADDNDGAAQLFNSLGLHFPEAQTAQAKKEGTSRFQISPENVSLLNSDLLVMAAANDELKRKLEGLPGFSDLTSVKSGAVAWMSFPEIFGLNTPSALSMPFLLDKLTPALAAAGKAN